MLNSIKGKKKIEKTDKYICTKENFYTINLAVVMKQERN